jgi:2-amino-4-hydroxy-6-hydroxymethyldihydropteridine diphosphokinase
MNQVIIGIGSNIDPQKNIQKVREILAKEFQVLKESSFVETKPVGNPNQANFINGTILIQTDLSPEELKTRLCTIEVLLGRNRTSDRNSPRTIDLDIAVWNGNIVDLDVHRRPFLSASVLELWPELERNI